MLCGVPRNGTPQVVVVSAHHGARKVNCTTPVLTNQGAPSWLQMARKPSADSTRSLSAPDSVASTCCTSFATTLALAVALEKAGGVGGTWYLNKYPGANSDTEGFVYRYSFDHELCTEATGNAFLTSPTSSRTSTRRRPLRPPPAHPAGNRGDRRVFNEDTGLWTVHTDRGVTYEPATSSTRSACSPESNIPDIPGLDTFAGPPRAHQRLAGRPGHHRQAGRRDRHRLDRHQFIVAAATTAGTSPSFQRSPQYSVPSGNGPRDLGRGQPTKTNFNAIWDQVRSSGVALGFEESTSRRSASPRRSGNASSKPPGTRAADSGSCSARSATSPPTRRRTRRRPASSARKIAEIVKDPETARKLMPNGLHASRPLCDSGYYETFNRPNVSMVT